MEYKANEPIKSQVTRVVIIIGALLFIVLVVVAVRTDKIKKIGPVEFNNKVVPDTMKVESTKVENRNNYGVQIHRVQGDVLTDSSTKNVYNYNTSSGKKNK